MKRTFLIFLLFSLAIAPADVLAQGGPVGGSPGYPISTPAGTAEFPTATEADDGKPLTWDFAGNAEAWSDLDPDVIAGDTVDDDAIDTAVLSADAQVSLGLADSATQPGDLATIATTGDLGDGTGTISFSAIDGISAGTVDGTLPVWNDTTGAWWEAGSGLTFDGSSLVVPLGTINPAAPGLKFVGKDAGFAVSGDGNSLYFRINGTWVGFKRLNGTYFGSGTSTAYIPAEPPNGSPAFIPNGADTDTGFGREAANIAAVYAGEKDGFFVDGTGTYPTTTIFGGAASGAVGNAFDVQNPVTGADGGGVSRTMTIMDALDVEESLTESFSWVDESAGTAKYSLGIGGGELTFDGTVLTANTANIADLAITKAGFPMLYSSSSIRVKAGTLDSVFQPTGLTLGKYPGDSEPLSVYTATGQRSLRVSDDATYPETTIFGGAASGAVGNAFDVQNPVTGADGGGVSRTMTIMTALDTEEMMTESFSWVDEAAGTTVWAMSGADSYSFDGLLSIGGDLDGGGYYATDLQNFQDLGASGPGYWFDGVDDYTNITADADFSPGTHNFSIVAQIRSDGGTYPQRIIHAASGAHRYILQLHTTGEVYYLIDNGTNSASLLSTEIIGGDETNHIVSVAIDRESADGAELYLDGELIKSGNPTAVGDTNVAAGNLSIGADVGLASLFFNGGIFGIKIFNLAISATEVKAFSNGASIPYKYIGASQTALTSGTLTIGKQYTIDTFAAGDDFTNVGAASNASGVSFVATGTTPTTWTNASSLRQVGCVLDLNPGGVTKTEWVDASGNGLNGTVSGAIATGLPAFEDAWAEIYVSGGSTAQAIATGATATKSTAFTTNGASSVITADVANDNINLDHIGAYRVSGSYSFGSDTATNVIGTVFLDGVEQPQCHFQRLVSNPVDVGSAALSCIVTSDAADEDIDFRLKHDDAGSVSITLVYGNLNANYLGE